MAVDRYPHTPSTELAGMIADEFIVIADGSSPNSGFSSVEEWSAAHKALDSVVNPADDLTHEQRDVRAAFIIRDAESLGLEITGGEQ